MIQSLKQWAARPVFRGSASVRPRRCIHTHATSNTGVYARRFVLGTTTGALLAVPLKNAIAGEQRVGEVHKTDEEWRAALSPEAYRVLRLAATERPGTSPLNKEKRNGTFVCAGCDSPLFASSTKYNSGTGWPSFYEALPNALDEVPDYSIPFMPRVEIRCHKCQGHLGHVFEDGPAPTGLRYCMNGVALKFVPAENA